jgi:hypothetical protein
MTHAFSRYDMAILPWAVGNMVFIGVGRDKSSDRFDPAVANSVAVGERFSAKPNHLDEASVEH